MEHECYELRCSDVGLQCDYVAKGHTMDELMEKAIKHSAEVHDKTEYSDEEMKGIMAAVKHDREC
jgi:predicted small metal-binding protein